MKYYSYEDFKCDTKKLLLNVKAFEAEVIVGIARGGLTLSHAIAEGLDIREVQTLRTELYDKTCKREMLSIFGDCNFQNISRVLVVDDIADSGDTLKAIMEHLRAKYKNIDFKATTLFYKKTSVYEPDFWVNEADEWIDFFWERDFKVNAL
ncbi:phosphoribosyltransferase [Sulfurimonas sp.]|uniref:phosphoribosyltransferase n=1 Tax=Sulfurimonas sp. TaxID=2022749 RepID=UPI002B4A013E|nr:phosphoribosyltransferase family protein [Sulfurimonas sp.]